MAGLFKPFWSTSANSIWPTLSKQVDGGNSATNSKPMWAMSINFLVARAGLANTNAILQKQNSVDVNGYNTCTLSWLKNSITSQNQVKFSSQLLRELAISILIAPYSIFTTNSIDLKDKVLLISKITHNWMNQFMDSHNIVLLSQRMCLTCSPKKKLQIEMENAYHLDILQRRFVSGESDEKLMENLDETHFVVNLDNGCTLGFRGDSTVKYAKVVSGGESMTMVVRISGGQRATIEALMLIFSNENRSYPIWGLIDDIPKVSYRTGPKGWMDQTIFPEYFLEPRAYQADLHHRQKIIWLDNCSGHAMTLRLATILVAKNTIFKFLPPCSTHQVCQPANTFLISKIKDAWTRRWEPKKTELIQQNAWQNAPRADGQWSGKLTNPGKRFFLQLSADSVEEVNREVDCDNISYARKAMIWCGLALGLDGS